jgi:hypothetical protein
LLAHRRWFSPGTLASSTTKTGRHDIAEILPKVALNTKNQSINHEKIINLNNTTGATSDAGVSNLHGTHEYSISDVYVVD